MEKTTIVNRGFQNNEVTIGVINAGDEVNGTFVYNGPRGDIDGYALGCSSCTTIKSIKGTDDGKTLIDFLYKDTHVSNAGAQDKYPGGVINVTKNLQVFFNDGEPLKIPNENGPGEAYNFQGKERTTLYYRVDVKI